MFVYVWEYLVLPERVDEFVAHYGHDGAWVRLFQGSAGYEGTELVRDRRDPTRFLTVDRWASHASHAAFLQERGEEFVALDARCENLTRSETLIGHFEAVGAGHAAAPDGGG